MTAREFRPGDVAVLRFNDGTEARALRCLDGWDHAGDFGAGGAYDTIGGFEVVRPLVVLDPEDREDVERLTGILVDAMHDWPHFKGLSLDLVTDALREFADPTPPKPPEPTDPRTRVTDRRDNIWRLLADGDWVCTSGPDIGEYLTWGRLAEERGPLTVKVIHP